MRGSWAGIALMLAGCSTVSIPVDLDVPLVASPNAEDGRFAIWSGMQSLEAIEAAIGAVGLRARTVCEVIAPPFGAFTSMS